MMYFVIPCFNEESTVCETASKLTELLKKLNIDGKILFVNDKSTDNTEKIINGLKNDKIEKINTEKNGGQQKALVYGLLYVYGKCDFAITLDCDLQDDISVISEMIDKYQNGADAVLGVRKNRKTDSFFKKASAWLYYFALHFLDNTTVKNHGDFRLMSNDVIGEALKHCGKFPYLRGLIPKLGFKTEVVYYNRLPRKHGKSKYTFIKMLKLAFSGIYTASLKIK